MAGSVVLFPLANYATGSRNIERNIPGQIESVTFSLLRCTTPDLTIWPNQTTTLEVILELSEDGGVTWNENGRFTAEGGIAPGRHGGEAATTSAAWQLPGPQTVRGRLTFIVAGGPLRSEGTLSWA